MAGGPQPWVTGPIHVYVGVAAGFSPVYLGTGAGAPQEDLEADYEAVINDLRGRKRGFDYSYQGEGGFVGLQLTRWVEAVLAAVESLPNPANVRGSNPFGDMGSLMLTEGLAYPLWLLYPYSPLNPGGKAAYAGMPAGRHFYASWLVSHRHLGGTRGKMVNLIWQCEQAFNPQNGAFGLYDANMTGLPAPN